MVPKSFRTLTIALIFSGALNIALVAAFAFFNFKDTQISQTISKSFTKELETTNEQILRAMSKLTFRELVSYLTNKDLLEEGFAKRDLALAALTAFHHFNLEKALSSLPAQVRTVQFAENEKIDLFPGLAEDQFEAIIRYAYQEKWPLTAKGLFTLLQKKELPLDESLDLAFAVTTEFHALQTLFQKTGAPQEPSVLLSLVREGSWEILENFTREQSQILDFSIDKRRSLLLSYLSLRSPTAAELLLRTDFVFALKKLEDRGILDLLVLLTKPTEEGTRFCVELLRSPRSDAVWQKAALTLYTASGKAPVEPIDPKTALADFAPAIAAAPEPAKKAEPAPVPAKTTARFHVVKDGESLWKISRQYKVKVDEIVKLNGLEKDSLYPGMTLKIP